MTKQSMGQLVTDMERLGFVGRIPDLTDQRAKLVRLTELGWELHEVCGKIAEGLDADRSARVGAEQFAELKRRLKGLIATLNA